MIGDIIVTALCIIAFFAVCAFIIALIAEASFGYGYPLAFYAAIWSAMVSAICLGLILLLLR
jgi:hypothetical protein